MLRQLEFEWSDDEPKRKQTDRRLLPEHNYKRLPELLEPYDDWLTYDGTRELPPFDLLKRERIERWVRENSDLVEFTVDIRRHYAMVYDNRRNLRTRFQIWAGRALADDSLAGISIEERLEE